MAVTVKKLGNPTILVGGTSWSDMYSGYSTTPGWIATITDDLNTSITNQEGEKLKRLHLEVFVGRTQRNAGRYSYTVPYKDAPQFYETPTYSFGFWTSGGSSMTGNQKNVSVECSILSWSNGSFTYCCYDHGTVGYWNTGMIFVFDGFTFEPLKNNI